MENKDKNFEVSYLCGNKKMIEGHGGGGGRGVGIGYGRGLGAGYGRGIGPAYYGGYGLNYHGGYGFGNSIASVNPVYIEDDNIYNPYWHRYGYMPFY
jgi:hypothetical protein